MVKLVLYILFIFKFYFMQAGDTWYQMYIAESLSEDYLSFNAKLNLTVLANNDLEWSYSGQTLSTLECHSPDEYSYSATRTDKAVFESMYNTVAFVSSDPSQYLLAFQCYDLTAFDERYCGSGGLVVYLLVKNQRPDSFPLMSAVNDLKRNTDGALTFDGSLTTRIGSAFKFHYTMIGEHSLRLDEQFFLHTDTVPG